MHAGITNEDLVAALDSTLKLLKEVERGTYMKNGPDRRLAAFVRDLTDETPLTAQLLPSLGGEQYGESELMFRFGKVRVFAFGAPEQWTWGLFGTGRELKKWMNPLTVGQLHLIRMYIEGRQ